LFVDSHCHLDKLKDLPDGLDGVIKSAQANSVEHMLCVATSVREYQEMLETVSAYANVSVSCGVHPLHQADACDFNTLLDCVSRPEVVAVGETGLDYHYSPETKAVQQTSFVDHINAANRVKKPLIVHTRDAHTDTIDALSKYKDKETKGVLHCFTESLEMAEQAMELGFYISISGIVTFKSASELQQTVKQIPLDRLLIETDSPWLAPVPHRGKENKPAYVKDVAYFIADLKGVSVAQLAKQTTDNFYRLFDKIKR